MGRPGHAKLQSLRMGTEQWVWRVVLVQPRNPLNIGAAARAMANFGLRDLVLVNPHGPVWDEVRSAVGAEDIIKAARTVQSLLEAVGEATLVLGTTSGSRRNLDQELIPLQELPKWFKRHAPRRQALRGPGEKGQRLGMAALLLGSEKTGLSNEDLSYCHGLVRIPTASACPSMNLGQAVAVCCYELARAGILSKAEPALRRHLSEPANVQSLEHLYTRAERVLEKVGYLKPKSREATLVKLRRLMMELRLTNSDARILGGVLAQIEWKLRQADARSQKPEVRRQDADG